MHQRVTHCVLLVSQKYREKQCGDNEHVELERENIAADQGHTLITLINSQLAKVIILKCGMKFRIHPQTSNLNLRGNSYTGDTASLYWISAQVIYIQNTRQGRASNGGQKQVLKFNLYEYIYI